MLVLQTPVWASYVSM